MRFPQTPMVFQLHYSELIYIYRLPPATSWEPFYGPEATLTVLTLERVFYSEPHVSIAEFASQLGLWLKKDFRKGKDFIYSPIDSELPDFLSIKHFDGGWKLSSAIQKYPERNLFSTEDIRAGAETFISILFKDLKERYGIDTKLYMKPVRFA